MYASLISPDSEDELHLLRDRKTRSTTGSIVSSLYRLKDVDNKDGAFFVFPDLSVRMEGSYRLKFSLFEIVDTDIYYCTSICSSVFHVFPAKKFPGMEESTFLSKTFAEQGLKIRIRKEVRTRKSGKRNNSDGESSPERAKKSRTSKSSKYESKESNGSGSENAGKNESDDASSTAHRNSVSSQGSASYNSPFGHADGPPSAVHQQHHHHHSAQPLPPHGASGHHIVHHHHLPPPTNHGGPHQQPIKAAAHSMHQPQAHGGPYETRVVGSSSAYPPDVRPYSAGGSARNSVDHHPESWNKRPVPPTLKQPPHSNIREYQMNQSQQPQPPYSSYYRPSPASAPPVQGGGGQYTYVSTVPPPPRNYAYSGPEGSEQHHRSPVERTPTSAGGEGYMPPLANVSKLPRISGGSAGPQQLPSPTTWNSSSGGAPPPPSAHYHHPSTIGASSPRDLQHPLSNPQHQPSHTSHYQSSQQQHPQQPRQHVYVPVSSASSYSPSSETPVSSAPYHGGKPYIRASGGSIGGADGPHSAPLPPSSSNAPTQSIQPASTTSSSPREWNHHQQHQQQQPTNSGDAGGQYTYNRVFQAGSGHSDSPSAAGAPTDSQNPNNETTSRNLRPWK